MARLDDEVTVFRLACMIEDLGRGERSAMQRVAKRLEREWNLQSSTGNPRVKRAQVALGRYHDPPACTYSDTHDKTCICRGDGRAWEPDGGWLRLAGLIGYGG